MKCPICKAKRKTETYYAVDHIVGERYENCTSCHRYYNEYAYGSEMEYIDGKELYYHYLDSKTRRIRINFIRKQAVQRARKRYKRTK